MTAVVESPVAPMLRVLDASKLVRHATTAIERTTDTGITVSQLETLQVIGELGGAIERTGIISDELGVTPPVATGLVDRLVRLGYVERGPIGEDRRRIPVVMTDKGWDALRRAQDAIAGMK